AYADADLFIFPSHHPTETFGLVLIEAMAFGLPIVTTRWRGIPHVVGDEGCAKLCEVKNSEGFASSIKELMEDPELRVRMGRASRQRYEKNFTRSHFVMAMENTLRKVLADESI
ncbi:MAG: glycosyltransferase family 4 protein, partial [Verrucomicrobiae bacterium]|nr:glycosyltransferase family 4 protein [Verrucomicrobiae bacterium]NNJ87145.1 glycosyltransferase family 4 protein [Akkermansiaceae bacterium]